MGATFSSFDKTVADLEDNQPHLNKLDYSNTSLGDKKLKTLSEAIHINKYCLLPSTFLHA